MSAVKFTDYNCVKIVRKITDGLHDGYCTDLEIDPQIIWNVFYYPLPDCSYDEGWHLAYWHDVTKPCHGSGYCNGGGYSDMIISVDIIPKCTIEKDIEHEINSRSDYVSFTSYNSKEYLSLITFTRNQKTISIVDYL